MDLLCFCSVLCLLCLCARLFICALWSPAGKGLTSWLLFVVSTVSLSLSHCILGQVWYLIVSIPDLCTLTYFENPLFAIRHIESRKSLTEVPPPPPLCDQTNPFAYCCSFTFHTPYKSGMIGHEGRDHVKMLKNNLL